MLFLVGVGPEVGGRGSVWPHEGLERQPQQNGWLAAGFGERMLFAGPPASSKQTMLFAGPPTSFKHNSLSVRSPVSRPGCRPLLPLAAAGRILRHWGLDVGRWGPKAASCGARSGGIRMTVPQGEGGDSSGQPLAVQDTAEPALSSITVGIPVPAEAWDKLLQVWRTGSNKNRRGRDRMNMNPLMAISFPLELYGRWGGKNTTQVLDAAAERIAETFSGIAPFQLDLGKVECVPNVDGGWSVVVEAAESRDLAQLREQLLLLFPQSGNAALFASPLESGFVARMPLATYRSRAEAYATCQRLTASSNSTSVESAKGNSTNALLSAGGNGPIGWNVNMTVVSMVPSNAEPGQVDLYRVMALGNVDAKRCEKEYKELVAALASGRGRRKNSSRPPNKDELRVLRQVMGDFATEFEADRTVRFARAIDTGLAGCCACSHARVVGRAGSSYVYTS